MSNQFDYVELRVADPEELARTRDFLSEVFGWSYKMWTDAYADTPDSGVVSGISVEEGAKTVPLPAIQTADLEGMYERVKKAGGEITVEIWSFPGGRRFNFREPSGNEIAVWTEEPLE